jgi:hypothetical protein
MPLAKRGAVDFDTSGDFVPPTSTGGLIMNKIHIIAAAAILTTLAMPSMASAQAAIVLPPSYSWDQLTTTDVPGDPRGSVTSPTRHHERHHAQPYGQW